MTDLSSIKEKFEARLQQSKQFLDDETKELPSYEDLRGKSNIQKQLQQYAQRLVKTQQKYSKIQADLLYMSEAERKLETKVDLDQKDDFLKLVKDYTEDFKSIMYVLRERKNTLEMIIETLRSIQTHASSKFNN